MVLMETERLIVRDERESDLNDMHRLWSDKKTMYFLDDILSHTIEDTANNLKIGIANSDGHYFCVCDKATGSYMGNIGYTITEATPLGNVVHMGYMLLPEYHGQGYIPEAVKKVIEFAFTKDNCVRITTGCYKDNDPSRKVMEKAGFRKEGERIKAQYHDGVMKDRLDYAINKDEFMENKQIVSFNMYEMEYTGGTVESELPLVPFDERYYEEYKSLIDECFYEMRKALNIRPYEKHSYSLEEPAILRENTFLLINGNEIICAVTCSKSNIENVAVNVKYQRQGYGKKLMEFAISYMQRRGDSSIKLSVVKWNGNAVALYKPLGFVIVKETTVEGTNTKGADGIWFFEFTATNGLDVR